jgi:hypothetical protein
MAPLKPFIAAIKSRGNADVIAFGLSDEWVEWGRATPNEEGVKERRTARCLLFGQRSCRQEVECSCGGFFGLGGRGSLRKQQIHQQLH